jgi:glycosyltransferase involved in cell wall biosynthesis
MRVSVILSTYNQPDWLEKVLWGYHAQTHRDFEIVIADDGSREETRRRIDELRSATGLAIRHIWHEDRGFRKCTILNRAIEGAKGDFLIISDGDCVPRWDFVAQHVAHARPARFLSGGTVRLPLALSHAIMPNDIRSGRFLKPSWLFAHRLGWNKKLLMILSGPRVGAALDRLTTTRATFNGGNASAWKADIVRVNGFDERMEWGGEDRELGERLVNAGTLGTQMRYRAICLHLEHGRGYVREDAVRRNQEIREETLRTKRTWTDFGIMPGSADTALRDLAAA